MKERIFRAAWNHLLCQGHRSQLPGGAGLYGTGGRRDPVGLFIDIEHYSPDLEKQRGLSRKVVAVVEQSMGQGLGSDCIQLLDRLQVIHGAVEPSGWKSALERLAAEMSLPLPKPPSLIDRLNARLDRSNHESWCLRLGYGQPLTTVLRC